MESKTKPHDLLVAVLALQTAIERRSDAFFAPYGLTSAQFNILNLLAANDGRMEQLALVELLLVGKSSVSVVLNRMVRDGLIARHGHPVDRRQVILSLTPKGRTLWKKISGRYYSGVEKIFGVIPRARRSEFLRELQTLQTAVEQYED